MSKTYIREKRVVCGPRYMEVDIFPITERQYNASRATKKIASRPAQIKLNEKNARRHLVQLTNTNFTENDVHLSTTYGDKFMPKSDEDAERDSKKYRARVNYRLKKLGKPPAKYICVTEYREAKSSRDKRYHHHFIISCDLSRDELEDLWSTGPPGNREPLGYANADRLRFDNDTLEELCNYLVRHPNRKRRWSQSRGLKMPKRPRPADKKYKRRSFERAAKDGDFYDKDYVRNLYPDWECNDATAEYNDLTGWSVYLKMRRIRPVKKE